VNDKHSNFLSYKPINFESERCNGCINCMKRCPTEAIRVRDGKAKMLFEKCVGCGECVRVCPTRAKSADCDRFEVVSKYKYKIALACPSIYGQINNVDDVNFVLDGLLHLGFDDVIETGLGIEIIAEATRKHLENKTTEGPIISSACPAVVKLIMLRFENLLPLLSPYVTPEEVVARIALRKALALGYNRSEIGVFVISPCSAKAYDLLSGVTKDYIDGIISFSEIYAPLLAAMNKIEKPRKLSKVGKLGVIAGSSGNLARAASRLRYLSADGVDNVINILQEIEYEKLNGIDYIELSACTNGCIGGCFNVENPFVARARLRVLSDTKRKIYNKFNLTEEELDKLKRESEFRPANLYKLSDDLSEALSKMAKINDIYSKLPGLDCGGCGAPSCRAFAEDVVAGVSAKCRYINKNFGR
jgi:iron only hydrogenase large subunit-like protein